MDTVTLVGRLLVSLAAVLGVMWLIARRMRKSGLGKDTGLIEVLGRQQLSRTASLAVVRIGTQALVVGVTDTQVSVLGDTDLDEARETLDGGESERRRARRAPVHGSGRKPVRESGTAITAAAVGQARSTATARPAVDDSGRRSPVAGSALSPQTWKQTVESLRELTTRS